MPKTASSRIGLQPLESDDSPDQYGERGAGLRNFVPTFSDIPTRSDAPTPPKKQNFSEFTQKLSNEILPVNIRSYISHLSGNRNPITEKNFSADDLNTLQYAVDRYPNVSKGYIGYGDYSPSGFSEMYNWTGQTPSSVLVNSFSNPAYRLETTLGRASFRRLPDGSIIIEDSYNFNPHFDADKLQQLRQQSLISVIKEAMQIAIQEGRIMDALNMLGSVYGNVGNEEGTPVSIKLPPPQTTAK